MSNKEEGNLTYTYKDSGVDIEKGDALVEKIKAKVAKTYGDRVHSGVGGFACLYQAGDRYLAAGTDGVGTKLKLAFECNKHDTVGIDLVAMCINDIICTGAKPLFFMDYLACGKLDLDTSEKILDGIIEGCLQSECALIGGETAEMPGMYPEGEYDLAGFGVGEVFPDQILGAERIKAGDKIMALRSDGFHSNGFSLIRKLIDDESTETKLKFLKPTRIYWSAIKPLLEANLVNGLSHITGGGLYNIPRLSQRVDFHIDLNEQKWMDTFFDEGFHFIKEKGDLSMKEMLKTFNCGVGMVLITSKESEIKKLIPESLTIGEVKSGEGQIYFDGTLF